MTLPKNIFMQSKPDLEEIKFARFAKKCKSRSEHKIRKTKEIICQFRNVSYCNMENCIAKGVYK